MNGEPKLSLDMNSWIRSGPVQFVLVFSLLALGFGLRLINLTNPPLDFHAWRQLRAASIARGIYYQWQAGANPAVREEAIALGQGFEILEPRILEHLVAFAYLLAGSEQLWIARLFSILIWMLGGVGVFLLARRMSSFEGGLVSLGVFLLYPYAVRASRSFQPDPLMVVCVVWTAYSLRRWMEAQSWKWTIAAGVLGGLAVLVKVFAVYPVALMAVICVLAALPLKSALLNRKVWCMAVLMAIIPASYYMLQVGGLAPGYVNSWVVHFGNLLFLPAFYIRWLVFLHNWFDLVLIFGALLSLLLLPRDDRLLLIGLWIGYLLIGLSVPSLIITHDYYNLILIPIVALSLCGMGSLFAERLAQSSRGLQSAFSIVLIFGVLFLSFRDRSDLLAVDYRQEVLGWVKMGRELPQDARIIGISQDYNTRIRYYGWVRVDDWPLAEDQQMNVLAGGNTNMEDPYWENFFLTKTQNYDDFLVTNFAELDQQPVLKRMLAQYSCQDGEGYLLCDLHHKITPP